MDQRMITLKVMVICQVCIIHAHIHKYLSETMPGLHFKIKYLFDSHIATTYFSEDFMYELSYPNKVICIILQKFNIQKKYIVSVDEVSVGKPNYLESKEDESHFTGE